MSNIDAQIFFIVLIGFGVFVIILFGLDVYYLTKGAKREKEEKDIMSLKPSEKFLSELEKMIDQEAKKVVSEINQKINDEVIGSYKKQMTVFSENAEKKMADWDGITKKEILRFGNACSQAENSILEEAKKRTDELGKGLTEKIDQIYQTTTATISNKIVQSEKNIEDYKREKLKEIDRKIYQMIGSVAKKTIGKSIDLSTHEELVIQALEKAKREIF